MQLRPGGRRTISPDLLLVTERGRGLLRDNYRILPCCLARGPTENRDLRVVSTGHGDGFEPLEGLFAIGVEVCGQVGVVEPRPIRPGECAVRAWHRPEGQSWIATRG